MGGTPDRIATAIHFKIACICLTIYMLITAPLTYYFYKYSWLNPDVGDLSGNTLYCWAPTAAIPTSPNFAIT